MKCTDCGTNVKPIVAVDIDGTLSEYHNTLRDFACNYWDLPVPQGEWNGWGNYEDWLGMTQAMYRDAKLAYRQGGYKRVAPLQPYAEEFMRKMTEMSDVELWITTTRPWSRLDNVDPDTKFWLARHGFRYDHLLFDDNKYRKLSQIVDPRRVVAVVDDLPEMIEEAEEYLPYSALILIDRPYNAAHSVGAVRMVNLAQAALHVQLAVSRWYARNQEISDMELPGGWERADFTGGQEEVRS